MIGWIEGQSWREDNRVFDNSNLSLSYGISCNTYWEELFIMYANVEQISLLP